MISKRLIVALSAVLALSQSGRSQENEISVFASSSGAYRIEASGFDAFVILTKDPSQKVKVPMPGGEDSNPDDEFYFSPNDEWIFGGRHVGSCLQAADFYHRTSETKIDILDTFDSRAWHDAAQMHVIKKDYQAEGACSMTFFSGWSCDSKRLLVGLLGGEDRRDNSAGTHGYIYFNTATQKFEITGYLRKLNATKSQVLPCAEPTDALPSEAELKARLEAADKQLNGAYSTKVQKVGKDRGSKLRDSQRAWVKARDAGLQIYLATVPTTERERRKLQFLGDVTLARIESLNAGPAEEEPFDFWERVSSKR
jgi:uncharacterized protein YecT (DUF1311 family)